MKNLQMIAMGMGAIAVCSTAINSLVDAHRIRKARKAQLEALILMVELEQERLFAQFKPEVEQGIDDLEQWLHNIS